MPTVPNIVLDSPKSPREGGLSGWLFEQPDRARDLATIVSMLPDVVFKCEKRSDGKIYWLLNEGKLAEEFGLTTDKIKGKCLEELFPPHVVPHLLEHFERCFAGEAHEFVNELGGRYFKHYPQPVFDANRFADLKIDLDAAVPPPSVSTSDSFQDQKREVVERFERDFLRRLMQEHDGNLRRASRASGIERTQLRRLLKKHELI